MEYRIQQLKLGGILDHAVSLTKNHFGLLFTILAILWIPISLVLNFVMLGMMPVPPTMASTPDEMAAFQREIAGMVPLLIGQSLIIFLLVLPLTNAAIVDAVAKLYLGKPTSAMESIKAGLSKMLPLIGTSILMGLAIFGGLILLVIPGILFAFWFSLSTHVVVVEGISGPAALGRSRRLVSGNIGTMIVLGLIIGVIGYAVGSLARFIPQAHISVVLQVVLQAVMTIFSTAAMVVYYFSCRCSHENFDLEHLAKSMSESEAIESADGFSAEGSS